MNVFSSFLLGLQQYRAFQRAYGDVNRKSDRSLAAMGATRSDLVRLAWHEAERRTAQHRR
jgi:3-oxoacyl-[acyl-carrier-protein] synthase III